MHQRDLYVKLLPTPQDMVSEFHEAFDVPDGDDEATIQLRRALIFEEGIEVDTELGLLIADAQSEKVTEAKEALAKELADLVYVTYGTAVSLGIDLDEALRRVHSSNMSKLDDDGEPVRREDGKILKSRNYEPPDMTGVVFER